MSRQASLGKWAAIDIETTGIDPQYDHIIDVGYILFDGLNFQKSYSSLVSSDRPLSNFIQGLTGITPKMLRAAPSWEKVKTDLQSELEDAHLIAHNSDFERGFLESLFTNLSSLPTPKESPSVEFVDSMEILALLFPRSSSLKLENFIMDWEIAPSEEHRGFADALDLLKVLFTAQALLYESPERQQNLTSLLYKHHLQATWIGNFLLLDQASFFILRENFIKNIAEAKEWNFEKSLQSARDQFYGKKKEAETLTQEKVFPLEFNGQNIQNIYRNEEKMREKFPRYFYRKGQEELSLRTGQVLSNGVHAMVQAPTGTGKTLGYLLPSALYCLNQKEEAVLGDDQVPDEDQEHVYPKILVATGTKTLQQQAMEKDVPQLYSLLGLAPEELPIVTLMGSSNHLCEMLFRQNENKENELFDSDEASLEKNWAQLYMEWFFFHNALFPDRPFLRADIPYALKRKWPRLQELEKDAVVDFRTCIGHKCPFKGECTYIQGLRRAKEAKIVIGNHSLMFQWPRSFPRPKHIIVDEAHRLEAEATQAFGPVLSSRDLDSLEKSILHRQGLGSLFYLLAQTEFTKGESTPLIKDISQRVDDIREILMERCRELKDSMESFFKKRPRYTDLYWNESPFIKKEEVLTDSLGAKIFHEFESVKFLIQNLMEICTPYLARWDVRSFSDPNLSLALGRFETFTSHLEDYFSALSIAIDGNEDYASSLAFHEKEGFELRSFPIDIGRIMHDHLLETSESVLFTSATLGSGSGEIGGRGVEWASGHLYLDPKKRFKSPFYLEPQFDYENKARVFLVDDMPYLNAPEFIPQVLKKLIPLLYELNGRGLLLFSSKLRFEMARELLLETFKEDIPLFIQGMGGNIVEEFKRSGRGILLGMESFGEGIDIPGKTLQFVFIDKIPDLRQDYVIEKRRDFFQANLGNEFVDYYLAHRTRSLHQKLGRLIRTEDDFGAVIIVDSRTKNWKGRTLEKFHQLMSPYKIQKTKMDSAIEGVKSFLIGEVNKDPHPPS